MISQPISEPLEKIKEWIPVYTFTLFLEKKGGRLLSKKLGHFSNSLLINPHAKIRN